MIARIRGKVWEAYPNRLILDVQGVGYELHVPLSTFDHLHPSEGAVVELRTYMHVRETAHTLYGFATEEERDVFLLLIDRVSGIGPSTAMSVLSGLAVSRFKTAVMQGDVAELSKVKGLGKKTAERIILELKDKVGVTETWESAAGGGISHAAADAEMALIALGYKQVDARKAVKKVLEIEVNATVEELIRGALRLMQ
ncbi:MAG TPA: Holliday junction branch migration protein RuvA [Verrucomicrobiales bacterium]|jgi:Holliday junction DNA helicase RuvA|nr:MAG: Holliday junction branch migration protein RuvA [Verrucomicrobiae bacterium Tous-C3TDCM]PAZ06219.1 MAG: Holliday junction branch migration protein RuvA [Verrucomicrobiae bacterium AMD-G2]HBE23273.1 Holliday junction branch migration protein RuvA [Verrucomicrobiales bacterium]